MKELSVIVICIDPDAPILDRLLSSIRQFTKESLARAGNFSEEFEIAGGEDLDTCFKTFEAGMDMYVHHRVFDYHEWGSTGKRILGDQARLSLDEANYAEFKRTWIEHTRDFDRQPNQGVFTRWWEPWTTSRQR